MIQIIKRALRFIIKGTPINDIRVTVEQNVTGSLLKGKNILITGGARGIGFSIAKRCILEGAHVIICGRNLETLRSSQCELGKTNCSIYQFDVSDVYSIPSFLLKIYEDEGHIDALVNNAGLSFHEVSYKNVSVDGMVKQFNTNLFGAYFMAKNYLQEQEKMGRLLSTNILFVSSERGSICTDIPYGLSKNAINSLVGGLNNRVAVKGARINAIAPGVTVSDMTGRKTSENMAYNGSTSGRVLLQEEIAEVAVFLLSNLSKCISGEVVNCDFGSHLKCM